jgi:malonate transporter MadL subunit
MIIYGTAILALCHLLGIILGDLLGRAFGMTTNVGGVGIAMLLLIVIRLQLQKRGWLHPKTEEGKVFWGSLYIPVVVAMAMQQNVVSSLKGGPMALLAAVGGVVACNLCVAAINRMEPANVETDGPEQAQ